MLLCPTTIETLPGVLSLGARTELIGPGFLDNHATGELWINACAEGGTMTVHPADQEKDKPFRFVLCPGTVLFQNAEALSAEAGALSLNGADWVMRITPSGAIASSRTQKGLLRAFVTLTGMLTVENAGPEDPLFLLPCGLYRDEPKLANRMVHFCVFPETSLFMLRKLLRVSVLMGCTHAVVEFWGTLKLDCCPELAWPQAYTKEEILPLFEEVRALGLEIIPMFNHLGHAAQSRSAMGKHVVLDQNPSRIGWFSEDGWVWRIDKPEIRALLRKVRQELMELAGPGSWFHLGCDEAYEYAVGTDKASLLIDYLNEIAEELTSLGRRPIVWGDMLLDQQLREKDPLYICNGISPEVHQLLMEGLSRNLVIADWQYSVTKAPVETSLYFRDQGFDVLTAPWTHESPANGSAMIQTAAEYGLSGTLLTTWHTFFHEIPLLLRQMEEMHGTPEETHDAQARAAAIFRRAYRADVTSPAFYAETGWEEKQIPEWFR